VTTDGGLLELVLRGGEYYNAQRLLRGIAGYSHTYTLCVYDSCRVKKMILKEVQESNDQGRG
jgi:hypothetical protein